MQGWNGLHGEMDNDRYDEEIMMNTVSKRAGQRSVPRRGQVLKNKCSRSVKIPQGADGLVYERLRLRVSESYFLQGADDLVYQRLRQRRAI